MKQKFEELENREPKIVEKVRDTGTTKLDGNDQYPYESNRYGDEIV